MGDVKTDEMNKNERKFTKVISLLLRFVCFVWQQHCQNTRRRRLGTHKGNTNSQLVRMPLHAEQKCDNPKQIYAQTKSHMRQATCDMNLNIYVAFRWWESVPTVNSYHFFFFSHSVFFPFRSSARRWESVNGCLVSLLFLLLTFSFKCYCSLAIFFGISQYALHLRLVIHSCHLFIDINNAFNTVKQREYYICRCHRKLLLYQHEWMRDSINDGGNEMEKICIFSLSPSLERAWRLSGSL